MTAPVLVTGGTGFVGSHLVEALLARGTAVRCLVRNPADPKWLKELPVELVPGTLEDEPALERAVAGVSTVYHVAGVTKSFSREGYFQANADGAERIAQATAKVNPGVRRFLLVSSLAASGPAREGRPIREDDPCRPVSVYGESKLAGEEKVRALANRLPVTIVRPPIVFGPKDADFFQVFKAVSRHIRPHLGFGKTLSWVYAPDLADGIIAAAAADRPAGATYYLASPLAMTAEELGQAVARSLGVWSVPVRVPDTVTAALAWCFEAGGKLLGKPGIFNPEKAREIAQKSWVCDVSRARAELGHECATPLDRALGESVEWYRKRGWL